MNKKNIHILLVVFAVLVGGIFIRQQQVQRGVVTEDYSALEFSFDAAHAAKISISRGGGEVELKALKSASGWVLPNLWNAKADSEKIEKFLKGISALRGELRADDEALLADFGITAGSALAIQLTDEKDRVLADLRVGTKRAGATSIFMRQEGASAVYLVDLDLFRLLGIYGAEIESPLQPRLWANLQPLSFKADDLLSLEAVRFDGAAPLAALQLIKDSGENKPWRFSTDYSPFVIDPAKVESFIQALSVLRASELVDPAGSYGFETPALRLKIQTTEKPITVSVGQKGTDQKARYLRVEGEPFVYEIANFVFEDLLADDSRFFMTGLPGMDKAVVEAVTLTKQGQEKQFVGADANAFESIQQTLRTLETTGLLLSADEKKKGRSPGLETVSVEIKDGAKIILDLGERMEGSTGGDVRYAAQLRSNPILFSISETDYTNLFEALKAPPAIETNASQPAPNKAE